MLQLVGCLNLQVSATDLDVGVNSALIYVIQSESFARYFDLDPRSGSISARRSLDHETITVLRTTVFAVDHGKPARTGMTGATYSTVILKLLFTNQMAAR